MRLKFTLAIAMVLSGCGNKPKTTTGEPSLQETQAWMHDFVAERRPGATYEGSALSISGDVVLKPGADFGIIQGAYRLEL